MKARASEEHGNLNSFRDDSFMVMCVAKLHSHPIQSNRITSARRASDRLKSEITKNSGTIWVLAHGFTCVMWDVRCECVRVSNSICRNRVRVNELVVLPYIINIIAKWYAHTPFIHWLKLERRKYNSILVSIETESHVMSITSTRWQWLCVDESLPLNAINTMISKYRHAHVNKHKRTM